MILWTGHALTGYDAIEIQRNSFLPDPFRWAYYGWYFAVGSWMYRGRRNLGRLAAMAPWYLAAAIASFFLRFHLQGRDLAVTVVGWDGLALAGSGALAGWFMLFGGLGLALRVAGRPARPVRYLADSSYWVYLIHMPVVGLAQVGLRWTPWPCGMKFAVVLAVGLGVSLASYEILVRRTWIGRCLNGTRRPGEAPSHVKSREPARLEAA